MPFSTSSVRGLRRPATDAALAGEARRALAAGQEATLLLPGALAGSRRRGIGADEALLVDEDGRPQLLCAAGSAVVTAARDESPAVLRVAVREGGRPPGCVTLTGHLLLVRVLDDAERTAVVELAIARIVLERGDRASRHDISLELYGYRADDALAVYAQRLLGHTNAAHGPELRALAARRQGLDASAVAAAQLVNPSSTGCTLAWVDGTGAHSDELRFTTGAPTPRRFAAALRAELATQHEC